MPRRQNSKLMIRLSSVKHQVIQFFGEYGSVSLYLKNSYFLRWYKTSDSEDLTCFSLFPYHLRAFRNIWENKHSLICSDALCWIFTEYFISKINRTWRLSSIFSCLETDSSPSFLPKFKLKDLKRFYSYGTNHFSVPWFRFWIVLLLLYFV